MDLNKTLEELKKEPGFAENVGMILTHNGVVRAWSRKNHESVESITITHDFEKMEKIRQEMERRPGIFKIIIHANSGTLQPGDDVLFLIVAGDIRENVKDVFSELLDRIKSEAVLKEEHFTQK